MKQALKLWGPLSGLGLVMAGMSFALDQLHKWWMLGPFDIAAKGKVTVLPFLDLVLGWNRGISYGLLPWASRYVLIGLAIIICAALWVWLARVTRPLTAAALGLVIGGALANALDRNA